MPEPEPHKFLVMKPFKRLRVGRMSPAEADAQGDARPAVITASLQGEIETHVKNFDLSLFRRGETIPYQRIDVEIGPVHSALHQLRRGRAVEGRDRRMGEDARGGFARGGFDRIVADR